MVTAGFRLENDSLGELAVPSTAYYGIHTARAIENFPVSARSVNLRLIHAIALVKKASSIANRTLALLEPRIADAIARACDEIMEGRFDDQFRVDAFQGGAGTSTNMNVNEVAANRAIELLGGEKGDYRLAHPLHHVNLCQSTNDVYPTALKIAAIRLLRPLSEAFAALQESLQQKEQDFADVLKLGRTQLMDALPMMAGQEFGAYAKCVSRDRWRLYKAEERLREVNIGGTAIGTGMNAPRKFMYVMTDKLQELTGLGIARSEFPIDPTQNMDVFAEVSGLLKAAAVNLLKISNDLRLLNSGPAGGLSEIKLPAVQAGSSIMPGKVNPVIAEMTGQTAMRVIANDLLITQAAAAGQLELNAFVPAIAEALLESLEMMKNAVTLFDEKCVRGIEIDKAKCEQHIRNSAVLATALTAYLGYEQAAEIAKQAQLNQQSVADILKKAAILPDEVIEAVLNPYEVTKPGIPGK